MAQIWQHVSKRATSSHFLAIEKICASCESTETLEKESLQFIQLSETVGRELETFGQSLSQISLLSLILHWSQITAQDHILGERNLVLMNDLLESKLLPIGSRSNLMKIGDQRDLDHQKVLDNIRSSQYWPIPMREDYVSFYIAFTNWLSKVTYGFVPQAVDLDRELTKKRQLPHASFIKLISYLPERERILCKLFYFGGDRGLEEVLSLKIEDIDFKSSLIKYETYSTTYPKHVLVDIFAYTEPRRSGFVFVNKEGARINHTVPYRALKNAAQKLNFPSTFTFKDLVRDQ